ncbi:ABC transporter ATP-binding protein [Prochlorococcus marinus]|uniref:ABC transporter ATP-binding protein n=1 Tax=Prochlorococcus marinus TaxID=1219 RepID=UPI0022B44DBA|nr:ABC transporter ATP-binding protein [Prochlorococcus marinus]
MNCSQNDVLNIKGLSVSYPGSSDWVLEDLNMSLKAGERLALIGSSGSGKSTVAKVLLQILPSGSICRGQLLLKNKDLLSLNEKDLKRLRGELIGLIFQDPGSRLNPLMTIGEHLLDTFKAHQQNQSLTVQKLKSEKLLEQVGINPQRFNAYPHEFSGGMRQRLCIALAIALNPPLIIADEPTSSLDVVIANQIMSELSILCDELGSSLLLITHDLALASKWSQRIAILDQGKIVEEQSNRKLFISPQSVLAKKLVSAAIAREECSQSFDQKREVIFEVDRLRCWHPLPGVPWKNTWVKAIDEISFSLSIGETLGVVGVSGCGKSTLCRALLGLTPIRGGEVKLYGRNLRDSHDNSLKKAKQVIQMVFQDPFASLNPKMTVLEAISDPLLIHGLANKASAKEQTRLLLEQVGLIPAQDFQNRFPHQLSGGQQQRVAIARALAMKPKVLICDESVSMLDAEIQTDVLSLLRSLQVNLGLAILFITHDLAVASSFCHRIIVLNKGKIVEEGFAKQIISSPTTTFTQKLVSSSPRVRSFN